MKDHGLCVWGDEGTGNLLLNLQISGSHLGLLQGGDSVMMTLNCLLFSVVLMHHHAREPAPRAQAVSPVLLLLEKKAEAPGIGERAEWRR